MTYFDPFGVAPPPQPKPMRYVRMMIAPAAVLDLAVPTETWTLPDFVTSIRSSGYFMNDRAYVPLAAIQCITVCDGPPPTEGNVIPFKPS